MHPSACLAIPVFCTPQVMPAPAAHLFAVDLQVLGRTDGNRWQGWASDASDASRRAVADARLRWRGYSFVVRTVVQVGI